MSQLRTIVERIERLETEIADLNTDKRDIYAEAKGAGFDVKALKSVIAYRRKDPTERDEHDALVETYLAELSGKSSAGTGSATRARAREENSVGIAAGTPSPAQKPVPTRSDLPAPRSEQPTQTAQALQASVAIARAGGDPFDVGEIPAILDRRRPQ